MLPDLHLTDDEVAALGLDLGGCDFSPAPFRTFLQSTESCDVQAAPGSGKTTLLVAKLLHVIRRWETTVQGICVLSHTNAARREVEERLEGGDASELLAYPHFVGTVTAFVNRFISLPFLRGLGWPIQEIDNDIFAAKARRLLHECRFLTRQVQRREQFTRWVSELTLSDEWVPVPGAPPAHVPVHRVSRMPGPHTETMRALGQIKGALLSDGVYRYEDMAILAAHALDACPAWADRLAQRFPLVLVDEAQDTSPRHLHLLDRLFRGRSVIQRLGDCNQTIYDGSPGDDGWEPLGDPIDLGESHRFGGEIASFATRLTVRRRQQIVGHSSNGATPALLTFREGSATSVIPTFARLVSEACEQDGFMAWAVASIHRPTESAAGVSLQDYHPAYRAPRPNRRNADTLHATIRAAAVAAADGLPLNDAVAMCCRGIIALLRRQNVAGFEGRLSHGELWRYLDKLEPGTADRLKGVVRRCLVGETPLGLGPWTAAKTELLAALTPIFDTEDLAPRAERFLRVADNNGEDADQGAGVRHIDVPVGHRDIRIHLGSIASVKGQTHDATLVVQTTLRRTQDVQTALRIAAGLRARPTSQSPYLLKAATNVFVGATRPRYLLCLAMPDQSLDNRLREAVEGWGWRVIDCQVNG